MRSKAIGRGQSASNLGRAVKASKAAAELDGGKSCWGGLMNRKQVKSDPPSGEGTISTRTEQKQVEDRVAIGANVVYETIRREGEEELQRPASALAWSALAAGLSMGFSFVAEALLMARLPDQP